MSLSCIAFIVGCAGVCEVVIVYVRTNAALVFFGGKWGTVVLYGARKVLESRPKVCIRIPERVNSCPCRALRSLMDARVFVKW